MMTGKNSNVVAIRQCTSCSCIVALLDYFFPFLCIYVRIAIEGNCYVWADRNDTMKHVEPVSSDILRNILKCNCLPIRGRDLIAHRTGGMLLLRQ